MKSLAFGWVIRSFGLILLSSAAFAGISNEIETSWQILKKNGSVQLSSTADRMIRITYSTGSESGFDYFSRQGLYKNLQDVKRLEYLVSWGDELFSSRVRIYRTLLEKEVAPEKPQVLKKNEVSLNLRAYWTVVERRIRKELTNDANMVLRIILDLKSKTVAESMFYVTEQQGYLDLGRVHSLVSVLQSWQGVPAVQVLTHYHDLLKYELTSQNPIPFERLTLNQSKGYLKDPYSSREFSVGLKRYWSQVSEKMNDGPFLQELRVAYTRFSLSSVKEFLKDFEKNENHLDRIEVKNLLNLVSYSYSNRPEVIELGKYLANLERELAAPSASQPSIPSQQFVPVVAQPIPAAARVIPASVQTGSETTDQDEYELQLALEMSLDKEPVAQKPNAASPSLKRPLEPESVEECSVCLEDMKPSDPLQTLRCNHKFHRGCIENWAAQKKTTCPYCRSEM